MDQKSVGFALGATDYLIKPIRKPELLEAMHKRPRAHEDSVILLVDDDPKTLELLEETLRSAGYETQSVQSGARALEVLSSKIVSAVLLDGYRTVHRIRENPRWATLPVLAVTAYAMQGDKERILRCGFDGYLSKPINPSLLFQELERVLSTSGGEVASEDRARAKG